jgi:hypothetical protein
VATTAENDLERIEDALAELDARAEPIREALRVNLMLEELAARPEREAAETEEQRELRRMAEDEATAEVRGEWIDTEPDAAAVHDAAPERGQIPNLDPAARGVSLDALANRPGRERGRARVNQTQPANSRKRPITTP